VIQAMNNIASIASGILVEQKGCGVAVHYRNAPLARQALESEMAAIVAASSYELVLREGRKVLEAVPRGLGARPNGARRARSGAPPGRSATMSGTSQRSAAERLGGLAASPATFRQRNRGLRRRAQRTRVAQALASRLAMQQAARGRRPAPLSCRSGTSAAELPPGSQDSGVRPRLVALLAHGLREDPHGDDGEDAETDHEPKSRPLPVARSQ
jgi:hypothetical protein